MLEFYDLNMQNGVASIYQTHITLNKPLLKYFIDAYKVRIGFDRTDNKLYVFIINRDYAQSGEIPASSLLKVSLSKTYVRICSKAMVQYILKVFNLDFKDNDYLQFDANYDDAKKAVVINLKEEIKNVN